MEDLFLNIRRGGERLSAGGGRGMLSALLCFILISLLPSAIPTPLPTTVTIGGLFNAFTVGEDSFITKNDKECQNLAAFIMAVDEINSRYNNTYQPVPKLATVHYHVTHEHSHTHALLKHPHTYTRTHIEAHQCPECLNVYYYVCVIDNWYCYYPPTVV